MSTFQNTVLPTGHVSLTKEEVYLAAPILQVVYSALDNIIWCRGLHEWTRLYDMMDYGLLAPQASQQQWSQMFHAQ
jgi:hypothetical protein